MACILAATLVSGLSAYPLGVIALRLRGDYLAIVTLGFSESVRMILQKEEWLTRGVHGIPGIPRLFGQYASGAMVDVLILATLLLTNILVFWAYARSSGSPFGRTIKAIRDNEVAVMALGKNPAWFKTRSLMIGAALAGLAGAFTAHYLTFIAPEQFVPLITFYVWIAIIVGGVGSPQRAWWREPSS